MGAIGRSLLLLMSVVAVLLAIHRSAPRSQSWWHEGFGFQLGGACLLCRCCEWVNDGLLTIFFLVVGLEIKREFTVGRLATRRPPRCRSLPHSAE